MSRFSHALGDGEFEFVFMLRGEPHKMRGKIKDAVIRTADTSAPYVCTSCNLPNVDSLLDEELHCFRPRKVFFEFEEDERGKFSEVRRVQNEEV